MAYDLEEQEQLAEIKAWWKQYGRLVIVAVVAGTLLVGGIQGWRYYRNSQMAGAAALFEQQQRAERTNDQKRLRDIATQIVEHYPSTQYAILAALAAAKVDFETGDLAAAKKRLQWVIENSREDEARDVARLRLARVLLDEKNATEALQLLEAKHAESFTGLYADVKGDVLVALGKRQEARTAYQLALDKSEAASPLRQILQLKLDSLGDGK